MSDVNETDPAPGAADASPVLPIDKLSRKPLRDKPGFYAGDGLSPYAVAFLQPTSDYLSEQLPEESLYDYVNRQRANGVSVRPFLEGLREPAHEEASSDADGGEPVSRSKRVSFAAVALGLMARVGR